MLRGLLRLGLCCAVVPALAQVTVPVGVDLFGDGIVAPLKSSGVGPFIAIDPGPVTEVKKIPQFDHLLLFQDGRHICGTLAELTKDEVVWTRPDMEQPLRIARNEIRRIVFKSRGLIIYDESELPSAESKEVVPATVKLPGTDWLFGDVRAENGEDFSVDVAPGATLKFSRQAVQWLYFAKQPAPAFGFSGEQLGMEGWIFGNPSVPGEVVDGTFKMQGAGWIGRDISPPDRFVVDFEIPKGAEPTRLWLQPYRPSPNSYSTGTIELSFGSKEMTRLIFINRFERERTAFTTPAGDGPTRFRVFYDRPGERVAVMRNDEVVGDWKLRDKDDAAIAGMGDSRNRAPKGICFDRGQTNAPLQINRVSLQPWDGALPKPGEAPLPRMVVSGTAKPGKLEAISANEVGFAGEKAKRSAGMLIDLAQTPASLREANALVTFGTKGELAVADLEVRDGRARARSAAIKDFELPVNLMEAIAFPSRKVEPANDADTLVFRNGDSMSGKLMRASKDNAIHWKAPQGQELTFKAEHVAGVHFGGIVPVETNNGTTIELLSGDRMRADLESLNASEMRAKHPVFGARSIPRRLLKSIYPSPKTTVLDAGCDPEGWLGLANRRKGDLRVIVQMGAVNYGRVFLDGVFLNPPAQGSSYNFTGISQVIKDRDRYELRCEVTDAGGAEPYLTGSLAGNNGTPSLQINLGHGQLRVYSYNLGGVRGRPVQQEREVPLGDKVPQQKTRRELRIFVDTKTGTADFMVDGVHLMKFGQQKNERAPGLGSQISLSTYSMSGNMSMLSNVSLGPWNGEVPRLGEAVNGACLVNGDFAPGAIGGLADGKLKVGEGADGFEIPIDRVSSIDFGGEAPTLQHAARVRLADGTVLNLQSFRWEDGKLQGESPAFGSIQLPAKAVSELVLSPAPARFPKLVETKKLTKKKGADNLENAE
jgi:hypothetical protein